MRRKCMKHRPPKRPPPRFGLPEIRPCVRRVAWCRFRSSSTPATCPDTLRYPALHHLLGGLKNAPGCWPRRSFRLRSAALWPCRPIRARHIQALQPVAALPRLDLRIQASTAARSVGGPQARRETRVSSGVPRIQSTRGNCSEGNDHCASPLSSLSGVHALALPRPRAAGHGCRRPFSPTWRSASKPSHVLR